MRLEYRTNNVYDTVLLVDNGRVVSTWEVTPEVLRDFCNCSQDAGDWDHQFNDSNPRDYGKLVAVREGYTLRAVDRAEWEARVQFVLH